MTNIKPCPEFEDFMNENALAVSNYSAEIKWLMRLAFLAGMEAAVKNIGCVKTDCGSPNVAAGAFCVEVK